MIGVRAALWAIGFMGTLWAILGLFQHIPDVGIGMAVTAATVVAWGLMDWLEER